MAELLEREAVAAKQEKKVQRLGKARALLTSIKRDHANQMSEDEWDRIWMYYRILYYDTIDHIKATKKKEKKKNEHGSKKDIRAELQ